MVRKVASYTNGKCNYPFFVFKTYNAWNSAEVRGKHGTFVTECHAVWFHKL